MRVVSEQGQLVSWLRLQPGPSGHVHLDETGIAGLARAVETAIGARVLVIESEGAEFCAGMDLAGALARPRAELQAGFQRYADCLARLQGGPAASIAVVRGAATGGGVGLLAACDLVVAAPQATFALPELRFGLVPAVILPALRGRLNLQRIRRLALTGDALTAAQAEAWGLVDIVADDPKAAAAGLVRKLLRARPQAVATVKRWRDGVPVDGPAQTAADLHDRELRTALTALLADGEAPPWFRRPEGQE
jgi:enoyl-CoA hydratase/carnithine racemase